MTVRDSYKKILKNLCCFFYKKQYVTVGKIVWGDTMEIKDGLSDTDYIAFAYIKNAKEGVKTQKSSEATS